MKVRALALSVAIAASLVAAGAAHAAGGKRHSSQKALARSIEAITAFQKRGDSVLKAEIGSGAIGAKHLLSCTVDDGSYVAFAVGERGTITMLELSAKDEAGKELKPTSKAVDECMIDGISVEKKGTLKLEVEVVDTAEQGSQVGNFVVVLMGKKQPPEQLDFLFDAALTQVKAMEGEGYDVDYALFDTLSKDKPWALPRKLAAGSYRVDGVGDDNKVKDLDLQLKDASGVLGKDTRTDHISSAKAEVKGGDATVAVSATFSEGEKDAFATVLIGRKP
jgi:hypothetical protein